MTNLPNLLTLFRIFLVPLLVAALVQQNFALHWGAKLLVANDFFALILFLAAALTDLLDGYLARRWKQVTTVGTLLDPVADKLLISAALISLVQTRLLPGWMVILIISREFAVSGLRSIAAAEGYTIKAGELGKSKMMLQVVGVALIMLSIRWPELHIYAIGTMWAVVIFGLASAIDYFRKFWRKVDMSIKLRRRHELITLERQKRRLTRAAKVQKLNERHEIIR
ncbi:MAG: CDP-diacylglycerol--glycerol-3-phosphate 3-phosphatidyltransferase [Acidobacteriaceae bacterium]|nr:CDP-diacylglycerol--glycerol-3-phosphate 3-phosphatidyltransferase [Acidobacteriaceae bacterium]MBV9033330.1 CDP-diacylglycerol--glycerol-3-phosphate 3-phosphatidyltransferase [Acidobacteriaceae bacterium]MBV9223744.1 CDP-diacylglycerol--glycerol-3-phosphate 3-phosphatidyltransferase [Acidobacteriaceae bacterium]MBV9307841.1 CDP-diacylglycerol--glycerol-3-phosphate 3-phosphatidyltransferase [Acidobacteriaceae bacterium]MBV9678590.1 CDP-diacylglycerol--glycerol-3-phosphate 3-phosphatidyltrans